MWATTAYKCTLVLEWTCLMTFFVLLMCLFYESSDPSKGTNINCCFCHLRPENWGWSSSETTEFHTWPEDVVIPSSDWKFPGWKDHNNVLWSGLYYLKCPQPTHKSLPLMADKKEWDESFKWAASRMIAPMQNQIYEYIQYISYIMPPW